MAEDKTEQVLLPELDAGQMAKYLDLSTLNILCNAEDIELPSPKSPWLIAGIISLVFSAGFLALGAYKGGYLLYLCIAQIIVAFVLAGIVSVPRNREIREAYETLKAGIQELELSKDFLKEYLDTIDARATRFFHYVAQSDIHSYFILTQLRNSLSERLLQLNRLIAGQKVTPALLKLIHQTVKAELLVRDVVLASAKKQSISVTELSSKLSSLLHELDAGLRKIESQMSKK